MFRHLGDLLTIRILKGRIKRKSIARTGRFCDFPNIFWSYCKRFTIVHPTLFLFRFIVVYNMTIYWNQQKLGPQELENYLSELFAKANGPVLTWLEVPKIWGNTILRGLISKDKTRACWVRLGTHLWYDMISYHINSYYIIFYCCLQYIGCHFITLYHVIL